MAFMLHEPPVFIIGPARSGTTLVMAMIGAHPRIAVPEVTWYYPRFRPYLFTYGDLGREANFRTFAEEMVFGLRPPFFGLKVNPRTVGSEVLTYVPERTFAGMFAGVMAWYAASEGKPRWGEKTPYNVFHIGSILEDFPNAQVIYVTRDGRDTCADHLRSAFGPTNIFCAAETWKLWMQHAKRWRAEVLSGQWLDVRYETLVREPEATLRSVCAYLGEEYSPTMLEFYKGRVAQARGLHRDHKTLAGPASDKYIGIHKEFLSLREQRIFATVAGRELVECGYPLDVEPIAISDEEAKLFRELDGRIRAATLDAPHGQIEWESYNDWLIDQREVRRRQGVWSEADRPNAFPLGDPNEELIAGQRAWRRWKEHFGIKRRYII